MKNINTNEVLHLAAQECVRKALALIERAQGVLSQAAQELSSVQYGHPAQKRVMKLYDRVHAEWYKLKPLFDDPRIRLDRNPDDGKAQ